MAIRGARAGQHLPEGESSCSSLACGFGRSYVCCAMQNSECILLEYCYIVTYQSDRTNTDAGGQPTLHILEQTTRRKTQTTSTQEGPRYITCSLYSDYTNASMIICCCCDMDFVTRYSHALQTPSPHGMQLYLHTQRASKKALQ